MVALAVAAMVEQSARTRLRQRLDIARRTPNVRVAPGSEMKNHYGAGPLDLVMELDPIAAREESYRQAGYCGVASSALSAFASLKSAVSARSYGTAYSRRTRPTSNAASASSSTAANSISIEVGGRLVAALKLKILAVKVRSDADSSL